MRAVKRASILVLVAVLVMWTRCRESHHPAHLATFNIEIFPHSEAQVDGAFAEIAALDADAIAVQEIIEPDRFAREAQARLGPSWKFAHANTMPIGSRYSVHVGVLYDGDAYTLRGTQLHDDTRLDGSHKPVLEVDLERGGELLQIFVVHFKSGSAFRPIRAQQFRALERILARRPGAQRVVLGDFNATSDGDRDDLARVAAATGLHWVTEPLACSAFWERDDGCATSRLDHVLAWAPGDAIARGGCAAGCEMRDSCPLYVDQVSDHCPIEVTIP